MVQETSENSINASGEGAHPTRRHRAASRPAGAPSSTATAAPASAVKVTTAAAGSGGSVVTSETDASDLPRPPVGRRRAARTAKSPAEKPAASTKTTKTAGSARTEKPQAPSEEKPESRTRSRSNRSSRSRKSKAEETPTSAGGTNSEDIDAALERAARDAVGKEQAVDPALADPFGGSDENRSTTDILDSLAAEIGGGEAPTHRRRRRTQTVGSEDKDKKQPSHEEKTEDKAAPDKSEAEESKAEQQTDNESEEEPHNGRRRRRRGGRRRRRGDSSDESQDSQAEGQSADGQKDHKKESKSSEEEGAEESGVTRRRRRRRRRRGEDTSGAEDDPSEVVVKVREPRSHHSVTDEVTGIEGSTRMEAKKQRRREGRAAGRRRSSVLTEAEFLARRESVDRRMVVRQSADYSQLAVLEDGVLVEHYVDRSSAASSIGNVYLGKVQNVLPSMEAAFVDIGRGRNAVLYAGEVDWNRYGKQGEPKRIEHVLKSGDPVLVQVTKDPVGAKGARLTSHVSIPGRYIVYAPGGHLSGISRKLADTERKRLKKIVEDNIPSDASVIVRTAAEGASQEDLERDINRLKSQWEVIERKASTAHAPVRLYTEPDLTVRIIRDLFTADFKELVVAGHGGPDDAYDTIKDYIDHVAPDLADRLTRWDTESQGDPFATYRVDESIAKALERKVFLPSGGSLVIDRTEAMTVIDVNTGKFTGSAGNLEATVAANNLEAAEEIVRQLRLRDIGGIIVVDFIDMVLPANRELLVRRLVECLGRDRTRHQVSEVTSLGLVQMTRKKIGTGLAEAFTEECKECGGRGYHRFSEPVDSQAPADGGERSSRKGRSNRSHSGAKHAKSNSKKN